MSSKPSHPQPALVFNGNPPYDPFKGFFHKNPHYKPEPRSILDIRNAHRWFRDIGKTMEDSVYTFQQPLDGKSGPKVRIEGREMYMLSSYDYLGLIGHPDIEAAAIDAVRLHGTGTGGVRLLTGTTRLHQQLELELAAFKGTEASVVFSSGYMANLAVISALMNRQDRILVDAYIHRSLVDSLEMAGVEYTRFSHNRPDHLEALLKEKTDARRTFIIVEGIYSMDGDICPLPEIIELKKKYNAFLLVDEAHSFGNMGPLGRGINDYFGIDTNEVDIWTGSLSKTIPANGGFVATRQDIAIYLQHGGSPFMFSAALNPAAVAAALEAIRIIDREPQRIQRLNYNAHFLRSRLQELGYNTGLSESSIIPVIVGTNDKAFGLSRLLYDQGVLATAVIFPAVPPHQSRLRLCATSAFDTKMLEEIISAFAACKPPMEQEKRTTKSER